MIYLLKSWFQIFSRLQRWAKLLQFTKLLKVPHGLLSYAKQIGVSQLVLQTESLSQLLAVKADGEHFTTLLGISQKAPSYISSCMPIQVILFKDRTTGLKEKTTTPHHLLG
jgi:hypothetical protein